MVPLSSGSNNVHILSVYAPDINQPKGDVKVWQEKTGYGARDTLPQGNR